MSDNGTPRTTAGRTDGAPEARAHKSWAPGWIWAIPLAALAIVAWLAIRAMSSGIAVTVVFDQAAGMSPDDTEVTYRGLQVGRVDSLAIADDGKHVVAKLEIDRDMKKYLTAGTRFWLEGAKPDLSDLSSLKAVISGPTIVMEPGPGAPADHFTALAEAPVIAEPAAGTHFTVTARQRGGVSKGSAVYYLGLQVGKVTDARFDQPDAFTFDVFVQAPYDKLVRQNSRFWDASAVDISTSGNGVSVSLLSLGALISGAVAFETPADAGGAPQGRFRLYDSKDAAMNAPNGPEALYLVALNGAVGGLKVDAPVKLKDFTVGRVARFGLGFDAKSGVLTTPVVIALDPTRFHVSPGTGPANTALTAALRQLVAQGLRVRLAQTPPLIGGRTVELAMVPGAARAALIMGGEYPQIPAAEGGGLDAAITKVGNLPLAQIGENLRDITREIKVFVSSPKLEASLDHLDSTLANLDRTVSEARPRVEAMVKSLQNTADELDATARSAGEVIGGSPTGENGNMKSTLDELTQAARAIRSLADYLDRHPEALIKGR